jgi:hypothetical protein
MHVWGRSFGGGPLICSDPRCTGSHNDRDFSTLCPRTREVKRQRSAKWSRENPMKEQERHARYRTTAAGLLAAARNDAHRRGRG